MCAHINKKDLRNENTGVGGLARRPAVQRAEGPPARAAPHNTPYRTPYRDVKRVPCPCEMGGDRETSAESREIERELWAHRGSGASVLYLPGLVPKQNQII